MEAGAGAAHGRHTRETQRSHEKLMTVPTESMENALFLKVKYFRAPFRAAWRGAGGGGTQQSPFKATFNALLLVNLDLTCTGLWGNEEHSPL